VNTSVMVVMLVDTTVGRAGAVLELDTVVVARWEAAGWVTVLPVTGEIRTGQIRRRRYVETAEPVALVGEPIDLTEPAEPSDTDG